MAAVCCISSLVAFAGLLPDTLVAFPGAEGFGKYTSGGRGGKVVYVTTLADDANGETEGSLRWALKQYPDTPLTVCFAVSGEIRLVKDLRVNRRNYTIAGQTAPGMGIVITYSSYVKPSENLVASGAGTAIADLLFALLAGFAVMPAVFAAGIEPAAGPGLVFETLPYIFAKMGVELPLLSAVAAFLFFAALLIAALTSSISLAEVGVAYLVEEKGLKRGWACLLTFLVTWLLGLCCVFGPGVLDFLDSFSSNVLMTLGGLLCVVFVGWIMPRQDVQDELTNGGTVNRRTFRLLYFLMRYLAPLAVLSIFLSNLVW